MFILVGIRKDLCGKLKLTPEQFFNRIWDNRKAFLLNKGLDVNQNLSGAISDLLKENENVICPDSNGFKFAKYGMQKSNYQALMRGEIAENDIPDSHRYAKHGDKTTELFQNLIANAPIGRKIAGEERQKFNIKKRGITVLDANSASPTITSHPDDYVHYSEARIMTVRECARIQSFPDWFQFREKYTTGGQQRKVEVPRYTQVGNAIPPLFGEQVGEILKEFLDVKS